MNPYSLVLSLVPASEAVMAAMRVAIAQVVRENRQRPKFTCTAIPKASA